MDEFDGKVIVITGASEGIGRALALALAPRKPRLVLSARNAERLETLAEECRAAGAEALPVAADVTVETQCRELIQRAVSAFGGIDALVVNAGATMWCRLDCMEDLGVLDKVMAVNYFGAAYWQWRASPASPGFRSGPDTARRNTP